MKCETILRDAHALREAGRNHPPANRTERRARGKNTPQPHAQARRNSAAREEYEKWQEEDRARQSCQQPVRPFPPVDRLEGVEAHATVEFAILRNGLVFARIRCAIGLRRVGGSTPVIGFHSTIDRPDSVNRVAPPTIKVRKIIAAAASSHSRTATQLDFGRFRRLVHKCLLAGIGADHIVMGLHSQLRATKGDHVYSRA